jgi:hypothetical protein
LGFIAAAFCTYGKLPGRYLTSSRLNYPCPLGQYFVGFCPAAQQPFTG